jgi:hypothetical protein
MLKMGFLPLLLFKLDLLFAEFFLLSCFVLGFVLFLLGAHSRLHYEVGLPLRDLLPFRFLLSSFVLRLELTF